MIKIKIQYWWDSYMINLNEEVKRILDDEQNSIISSNKKYIYVSACPRFWKNIYSCEKN